MVSQNFFFLIFNLFVCLAEGGKAYKLYGRDFIQQM